MVSKGTLRTRKYRKKKKILQLDNNIRNIRIQASFTSASIFLVVILILFYSGAFCLPFGSIYMMIVLLVGLLTGLTLQELRMKIESKFKEREKLYGS